MKTYTICGSMRFKKEMQKIAFFLESKKGYNILQCVYNTENSNVTEDELQRLAMAHNRKIDMSDGIYVVNINGYIGESVSEEIKYAQNAGKEILYHCKPIDIM